MSFVETSPWAAGKLRDIGAAALERSMPRVVGLADKHYTRRRAIRGIAAPNARLLATAPVCSADEPFGGVDLAAVASLVKLLKRIRAAA